MANSCTGPRWKSSGDQHLPRRRRVRVRAARGTAAASVSAFSWRSVRPVSFASRNSAVTATALPDGVALSCGSLVRAISVSWSRPVKKKPPSVSSQNCSIMTSGQFAAPPRASAARTSPRTATPGRRSGRRNPPGSALSFGCAARRRTCAAAGRRRVRICVRMKSAASRGRLGVVRLVEHLRRLARRPRSSGRSTRSGSCRRSPGRTRLLAHREQLSPRTALKRGADVIARSCPAAGRPARRGVLASVQDVVRLPSCRRARRRRPS